jgi:hypothetical protein
MLRSRKILLVSDKGIRPVAQTQLMTMLLLPVYLLLTFSLYVLHLESPENTGMLHLTGITKLAEPSKQSNTSHNHRTRKIDEGLFNRRMPTEGGIASAQGREWIRLLFLCDQFG